MKLYQLRYFEAVCSCGHVTRAAEELHVSQPSVSNAIKDLENEFGVRMFHRINNRLTPTREGLLFLDRASKILELADDTSAYMTEMGNQKKQVKLGIPPMIGTFLFPKLFKDFSDRHPDIQLELVEGGTPEMLRAVEDDTLDSAIVITNDIKSPDICIKNIYDTEFYFCAGREHPLAKKKSVSFEEIKNEKLILFKNGYFQNRFVRSRFSEINAEPNVILCSYQVETMKNLVKRNAACAFLIKEVVEKSNDIVSIPIEPPVPIKIGVIWRRSRRQCSEALRFIKYASKAEI